MIRVGAIALVAALGAAPAQPGEIDIRSETLTVEHARHRAVFAGGVTAVRGTLTLRCPSVVADYDDASRVRLVTCSGPVTATEHGRTMTAGSGEFDNLAGVLTLHGEPTLVDGARRLVGEELTYALATEKIELTRARAQLPARDAAGAPRLAGQGPLSVTADRVSYDLEARSALFSGGVTARRGDLTLHATRLTTSHDEEGNVERALSSGGPVTVVQRDRKARAGKAELRGNAGRLVLWDDPVVTEKDSTLAGDRVTFLLGEDRVEVERPRASFPLEAARRGGK